MTFFEDEEVLEAFESYAEVRKKLQRGKRQGASQVKMRIPTGGI